MVLVVDQTTPYCHSLAGSVPSHMSGRFRTKGVPPRSEQAPAATSRQPEGLKPEREIDSTPEHLLRQGYRSGKSG